MTSATAARSSPTQQIPSAHGNHPPSLDDLVTCLHEMVETHVVILLKTLKATDTESIHTILTTRLAHESDPTKKTGFEAILKKYFPNRCAATAASSNVYPGASLPSSSQKPHNVRMLLSNSSRYGGRLPTHTTPTPRVPTTGKKFLTVASITEATKSAVYNQTLSSIQSNENKQKALYTAIFHLEKNPELPSKKTMLTQQHKNHDAWNSILQSAGFNENEIYDIYVLCLTDNGGSSISQRGLNIKTHLAENAAREFEKNKVQVSQDFTSKINLTNKDAVLAIIEQVKTSPYSISDILLITIRSESLEQRISGLKSTLKCSKIEAIKFLALLHDKKSAEAVATFCQGVLQTDKLVGTPASSQTSITSSFSEVSSAGFEVTKAAKNALISDLQDTYKTGHDGKIESLYGTLSKDMPLIKLGIEKRKETASTLIMYFASNLGEYNSDVATNPAQYLKDNETKLKVITSKEALARGMTSLGFCDRTPSAGELRGPILLEAFATYLSKNPGKNLYDFLSQAVTDELIQAYDLTVFVGINAAIEQIAKHANSMNNLDDSGSQTVKYATTIIEDPDGSSRVEFTHSEVLRAVCLDLLFPPASISLQSA